MSYDSFARLVQALRTLEGRAQREGLSAFLITLSLPARFHAQSPCYGGMTPAHAPAWLIEVWVRVRRRWLQQGIRAAGVRCVEPHRDGCPHWHLLLWLPTDRAAEALAGLRQCALADAGNEAGAVKHRVYIEPVDGRRISAVDYLVKFLGRPESFRQVAWYARWQIRPLVLIGDTRMGQPPAGVWHRARDVGASLWRRLRVGMAAITSRQPAQG
ncbi:hypothetical protein GCM10007860_06260 [Chitiniphilus shinanonensis]|uniref:Replication gene A protein-like domain-containing protein n=1 Tax=Chitiniphilus shinanonensis TaxID=553088 RepID=A0ABQ6BQ98_9NEIS|nr:replication endonuclease [Chitiniphilus shinanonensis]GLS03482.1 hypothetical protein GCM10007860_06260 [Chitiniphilus shinanonensis]